MIDIQQLEFGYTKQNKLFNHLKLNLTEGHICGLLGKNGAGKTTLLKLISGLQFPQSGELKVLNYHSKKREPALLQQLYFVPEQLQSLAYTIDRYHFLYAPFYPNFDEDNFKQNISSFKLDSHQTIRDLSHGQKKKFFISFGLATMTPLLILDEPTNGLDIPSKAIFRTLLAKAATDKRLIIVSTHQVHDVENLIDTIVLVDEGEIILNQSLHHIADKLQFTLADNREDILDCYYSEKTLNGYAVVCKNRSNVESAVNLELLFNAVIANKQSIQRLFCGEENSDE